MEIPTEAEIRSFIQKNGGSGFTLDEIQASSFSFSTRDNGDVGEETPGKEDIAAARELARKAKEAYPEATTHIETVDEWVHLDIRFPAPKEEAQNLSLPARICRTVSTELKVLLEALGFTVTIPDNTPQPGMGSRGRMETNGIFLEKNREEEVENLSLLHIEILVSSGESPEISLNAPYRKTNVRLDPAGKEDPAHIGAKTREVFQQLVDELSKERVTLAHKFWEELPYETTTVPADAVKVGNSGYDSVSEDCVFYRLPDGHTLYIDGENKMAYRVSGDNTPAFIRTSGDFYPVLPEGSKSLRELMYEITEELTRKIKEEAAQGLNTTLTGLGKTGTPHTAADLSIHFLPK